MTSQSVWDKREPVIRKLAGKLPANEIADQIGVSPRTLSWYCSVNRISLKVDGLRSKNMALLHKKRAKRHIEEVRSRDLDCVWKPTRFSGQLKTEIEVSRANR